MASAKRGPRPGKVGIAPIMVEYKNEQRKLRDLRSLAGGVSPGALRNWWVKDGSPLVVGDDFFSRYLASKRITTLDGAVTTYEHIAKRFSISLASVSAMVKERGRDLTSAMFSDVKKKAKEKKKRTTQKYTCPTSMAEREKLKKIPSAGSWEEKHLADCGRDGFCGSSRANVSFSGRKSDGRGCYNGRQ